LAQPTWPQPLGRVSCDLHVAWASKTSVLRGMHDKRKAQPDWWRPPEAKLRQEGWVPTARVSSGGSLWRSLLNCRQGITTDQVQQDQQLQHKKRTEEDSGTPLKVAAGAERFTGWVKSQKGAQKFYVKCYDVAKTIGGKDVKITWKSNPPDGLKVGDWVKFSIVEEYPDDDWGSPVAVDVVIVDPPEGEGATDEIPAEETKQAEAEASHSVDHFREADQAVNAGSGVNNGSYRNRSLRPYPSQQPDPPRYVLHLRQHQEPFRRAFMDMPVLSEEDRMAMLQLRSELEIHVEGHVSCEFPPVMAFEELQGAIPQYALNALLAASVHAPMPIQAQVLPLTLCGHDLLGIANSGAARRLAYLLPALVHIEAQASLKPLVTNPIALILAPTREIAVQIAEEANKFAQGSSEGSKHSPAGVKAVCLHSGGGGVKTGWQITALKQGCHVVAATPGRLIDLLEAGEVGLGRVTYFVLDEADRFLNHDLQEQVVEIANAIRPDRQTLCFSSVWSSDIQELVHSMCPDVSRLVKVTARAPAFATE